MLYLKWKLIQMNNISFLNEINPRYLTSPTLIRDTYWSSGTKRVNHRNILRGLNPPKDYGYEPAS